MKVRLHAPVHEARQWDGDPDAFRKWLAETFRRPIKTTPETGARLRVDDGRFVFSLAVGDWLIEVVNGNFFTKCLESEFAAKYEVAT